MHPPKILQRKCESFSPRQQPDFFSLHRLPWTGPAKKDRRSAEAEAEAKQPQPSRSQRFVLLSAPEGSGKSCFFRAMAGLWPGAPRKVPSGARLFGVEQRFPVQTGGFEECGVGALFKGPVPWYGLCEAWKATKKGRSKLWVRREANWRLLVWSWKEGNHLEGFGISLEGIERKRTWRNLSQALKRGQLALNFNVWNFPSKEWSDINPHANDAQRVPKYFIVLFLRSPPLEVLSPWFRAAISADRLPYCDSACCMASRVGFLFSGFCAREKDKTKKNMNHITRRL